MITAKQIRLDRQASELAMEITKPDVNSITLEQMRRLEQIERLAHNVQVKMKLTMSAAN